MVIDVVGSLFDQILSDPKVPPQMARQIARLQLPVLRAALGDPSFFSSRKHPVRRFVNRIASLGSAFDDFDSESGPALPDAGARAGAGDRRRRLRPDRGLRAEARRCSRPSSSSSRRREVQEQAGAATLLAEKETELRLQQRYTQQLQALLKPLPAARFRARLPQPGLEPGADARRAPATAATARRVPAPAPGRPRADHERAAQGLARAAQDLPDAAAAR